MSNDRVEVSETGPPTQNAPWEPHGESLTPEFEVPPPEPPPAEPDPAPPKPRRWRFVPRSLSSRLVAFVVGLVVVVVAAAGAATYLALKSFLYERLDQQLSTTASVDSIANMLGRHVPFGLRNPQTVWLEVINTSGDVVADQPTGPGIAALNLNADTRKSLVPGTKGPISVTTEDGTHLRLVSIGGLDAQTTNPTTGQTYEYPVRVLVGLSTSEIDRTLHRLVLLEVAIGALAVAAALAVTSWGVHLSLRPLNRVTRTAREVTAELSPDGAGLDRRVPEGDPQTEVGQLADSFNSLMGTVEAQFAARVESERRMRQFLADASHELRTPLTSIRGYAELARMRRANGEPEQADTLERIESEGTRMSRLVDDLLLLARSDRGAPPQRELVEVSELIEDAVDGARAAFPQRRIDVAAPPDLHLVGDHDQLLRVLRNLVTNAAVHTDPSGPIRVSAHAEGTDVVVRVIDSGPGLTPEQAQHVFERFWRADKARTRARGGSGLGLAIVASIVGAHQGTVDFQSTVEGGSTVTLRLPIEGPIDDSGPGDAPPNP
jgi:two-component system OmpR family sensor kinase